MKGRGSKAPCCSHETSGADSVLKRRWQTREKGPCSIACPWSSCAFLSIEGVTCSHPSRQLNDAERSYSTGYEEFLAAVEVVVG